MTSKGQITVPRDVRLKLNLKPGDRVLFIVEDDGAVRMRAANRDISSLIGILPPPKRKATLERDRRVHWTGRGSESSRA